MKDLEQIIKEIINDFLHPKPRLLCICNNFSPTEKDELAWVKCGNCNGWLSMKMIVERGINYHLTSHST